MAAGDRGDLVRLPGDPLGRERRFHDRADGPMRFAVGPGAGSAGPAGSGDISPRYPLRGLP